MNEIEKAIEILENGEWWSTLPEAKTIESYNGEMALHAAVDTALAALREQAERANPVTGNPVSEQPDNATLTLDELKGMDGEPVWCSYTKNGENVTDCRLVSPAAFGCIGIDEKYLLFRDYGKTWLAVVNKPKEEV